MRVTIAGASGFLGTALSAALADAGHEVVALTRSRGRESARVVTWTPDGTTGPWAAAVDGADVVINLAGDSIASGRWTAARKASILESRVLATRSLVTAINRSQNPARVFLSSSAQGYYGNRGDDRVTEDEPAGEGFLARVCVAWEAEAKKVAPHTRLVLLRTGVVLDRNGGALPRMLMPFRFFGGGPVGSGRQFMPWVHLRDWVGMARWAAENASVRGALNVCAPEPVRNRDLATAIGGVLHRPSWLPVPTPVLRAALGEMADELLLMSTRMAPARAQALGFGFRFPDLHAALANLL